MARLKGNRKRRRGSDDRKTDRCSELHHAEELIKFHGDNLRYVIAWQCWIAWDGKRWVRDGGDTIAKQFAVDNARRLLADARKAAEEAFNQLQEAKDDAEPQRRGQPKDPDVAEAEGDAKVAAKYLEFCRSAQNEHRLNAVLALASSFPGIAIEHTALDARPMLLTVQNGTINLTTGKLKGHSREHLITKIAPVGYNKDAKCPKWRRFLHQVMGGDDELVAYLQRHTGFCLTGSTQEHALVFHHGDGNNGKSTYLTTLHKMFGKYATRAARGLLFRSRAERHPTSLATLHGARFVTCSEIEEDQEFDEALIKDLTGGDPINARRMREDEWVFIPVHKLALAGNHKARVKGTDRGIWRRMHLVPWTVEVPKEQIDEKLPEKLEAELPGILAWAVEGCLAWQRQKLSPPKKVLAATEEYRKEQDVLGLFFEEMVTFEQAGRVSKRRLRRVYETWCQDMGISALGYKRFAQALYKKHVTETTVRVKKTGLITNGWAGVALKKAPKPKADAAPHGDERKRDVIDLDQARERMKKRRERKSRERL